MQDISQIERQLHILSHLSDKKNGRTIYEIMNYLRNVGIEVSRKTVQRDIDCLSSANFPIIEEKRGKNTYFYSEKFRLDNISFTISELISIYFIKEVLRSYSLLDTGIIALNLINTIILQLPKVNKEYVDNLTELFKVHPLDIISEKSIDPEHLNMIRDAVSLRKRIRINYSSFNKEEITDRVIDPYFLEVHEGCYHLIGFCHLRNSMREFRVSRINKIKLLDETFQKPPGFYEKYHKSKFGKLTGERKIKLKLRFTGTSARYVKEYESHRADYIYEDGSGGLLFERATTMTPDIIRWVLGFGGEAEVLEPEELRDEIKQQINKLYTIYF